MEIRLGDIAVGSAAIRIDGLYAQVKCICQFPDEKIYAVFLKNGAEDRLLGTCVPKDGCCILETKIPKKHILTSSVTLYAAEKYAHSKKTRIFLVSGEPVKSIGKLELSVFQINNGKPCLLIADEAQVKDNTLCDVNSINS